MNIDFSKYPLPKRMRHHTSPNLYLPVSELKTIPEYYPPLRQNIDWTEHFSDGKPPARLDVGCGKGSLLLETAFRYPIDNILGVELRLQPVRWLDGVIKGERIPNCSTLWYSAVNGLPFIKDNSIDEIYYLFPDPWHKKKHYKRRAFQLFLAQEFLRSLKRGGVLWLATDVQESDEHHREVLREIEDFGVVEIEDRKDWELPITNKERFCLLKEIPVHRLKCVKK